MFALPFSFRQIHPLSYDFVLRIFSEHRHPPIPGRLRNVSSRQFASKRSCGKGECGDNIAPSGVLPRRNSDFDRSIRSETVAIRCMTLSVPVADAALYLVEKVGAARIRQVSEVANKVCERMLVACAAMSLKNCHRFRGSGNVPCLIDHR
jgi:hypothetical protein